MVDSSFDSFTTVPRNEVRATSTVSTRQKKYWWGVLARSSVSPSCCDRRAVGPPRTPHESFTGAFNRPPGDRPFCHERQFKGMQSHALSIFLFSLTVVRASYEQFFQR